MLVKSLKNNQRLIGFCWLLSDEALERVVQTMKPMDSEKGATLINEGEPGDKFYIVESGQFDVYVNGTKVVETGPEDSFGELALVYSKPRAATVMCSQPGRLWVMEKAEFEAAMLEQRSQPMAQKYLDFLRGIPDFKDLNPPQMEQLGRALVPKWFVDGAEMLRVDGDSFEERFYILRAGEAVATLLKDDGTDEEVAVYSEPGSVISAETLRAFSQRCPVVVESCSDTTVALCMSTLTWGNILKGFKAPDAAQVPQLNQEVVGQKQKQEAAECVCM